MSAVFRTRYRMLRRRGIRLVAAALALTFTWLWVWFAFIAHAEEHFTLYFSSNVHGLSVGAPVKFSGQTVGHVSEIRIVHVPAEDIRKSYYAAVTISVNADVFKNYGNAETPARKKLPELIRQGFCGQLRMPSLLANGLCVSLYFAPHQAVNYLNPPESIYPEIPTNFKSTSELVDRVNTFIETKNLYDLAEKIRAIREKTAAVSAAAEQFDAAQHNRRVLGLLESANAFLENADFRQKLREINAELPAFCEILERQSEVNAAQSEEILRKLKVLNRSLAETQIVARNIRESLSEESSRLRCDALKTLRERCEPLIELGKKIFF